MSERTFKIGDKVRINPGYLEPGDPKTGRIVDKTIDPDIVIVKYGKKVVSFFTFELEK